MILHEEQIAPSEDQPHLAVAIEDIENQDKDESITMSQSSKLRVLQIVDGFRMGGAENKLWELIERLDANRFENFVANVGPGGPLEERFKALGVPIFQVQRRHRFDVMPVIRLRRIMREYRIDIVQSTLFWADVVAAMAGKWARVPVILSWETVTHEGNPYHGKMQRLLGYQFAARRMDKIVAVSHEIKQSLIKHRGLPPDKIEVIHYGVDLQKFQPEPPDAEFRRSLGIRDGEIVLGIVARLEPVKGHTVFLDAFQMLAGDFPNTRVLFAGDGSERERLQAKVESLGLADRVHFLGIRRDVKRILNALDIFVLPSVAGEGLPNVILEAMACAKPVVATVVGGTPEAVRDGENGLLAPPRDAHRLKEKLAELLQDPDKIRAMGKRSRDIAEREFSLEMQIERFESLYEKLYAEKKQH